jgi:hypothetical protein
MSKKSTSKKRSAAIKTTAKAVSPKGNHKPATTAKAKSAGVQATAVNGAPEQHSSLPVSTEPAQAAASPARLLPIGEELKVLYARYSGEAAFDEHDKAFYFVLDVGGLSRARQLIQHVEEVLAELEEFNG